MGRTVNYPCRHIVSFRINDDERQLLDKWSHEIGVSVSTIMRTLVVRMQEQDFYNAVMASATDPTAHNEQMR